ncbi:MAG: beta-glucosidase [Sphingobacteriales bacterium]|nr:MAG: beta-glucosidase [Sphingobacteriales bacterium]
MYRIIVLCAVSFLFSCSDKGEQPLPTSFQWNSTTIDGKAVGAKLMDVSRRPVIKLSFNAPVDIVTARTSVVLLNAQADVVTTQYSTENADSVLVMEPSADLAFFTQHVVQVNNTLKSKSGSTITNTGSISFFTLINPTDKFPRIPDMQLLDSVQRRTLTFFWEDGHPISGMARERNASGDIVTSGGTGFGIMAMISGVHRGFITRVEARDRITKITDFLLTKAVKYHGAYAHWINGSTGATVPFSTNDNGADLVETSYLVQGLLAARQYFDGATAEETALRSKINTIWEGVEWDWFRRNNENALYWHWSADKGFIMNLKIQGWNECLITYLLAASSPTHSIPLQVYDEGFARNGSMRNGRQFYTITLPLGPDYGGPLFFSHYSFLGVDPRGLKDKWSDYEAQVVNHSKINHDYCKANPRKYYGYSDSCWGLTASDNSTGYSAHSPTNDLGVISPTAALSSMPFTPTESMKALHYFYYVMGDRLWKRNGFVDAFELNKPWFANSFLAIDQGPIIVMIENHRSGLLWNLMKTCPELKAGMKKLGFKAPYL